ncbi:PHP domain-containing protein [Candidatus Woesearchaeota archaeon]|nr:PHP domain-containing protein [Candidatus Woesearchaeota archaeon]
MSNKEKADLHLHSEDSDDGDVSIDGLVEKAKQTHSSDYPITFIAITDHECPLEKKIIDKSGIVIIPGAEFSVKDAVFGFDKVHILGYFAKVTPKQLKQTKIYEIANESREEKRLRNEKYIRMFLSYNFLKQKETEGVDFGVSKATLVEKLLQILQKRGKFKFEDKTYEFKDLKQVWDLIEDRRFRQERKKISVETVCYESYAAGGCCSIAHPIFVEYPETHESFLMRAAKESKQDKKVVLSSMSDFVMLVKAYREKFPKLEVEVSYPYEKTREYRKIKNMGPDAVKAAQQLIQGVETYCRNNGISVSGGSDFHGSAKPEVQIGDGYVELEDAKTLLELT